jgi:hypothetical protein
MKPLGEEPDARADSRQAWSTVWAVTKTDKPRRGHGEYSICPRYV